MAPVIQPTTTVMVLVARKPGISHEQFKTYYEDRHIPWVTPLIFAGDDHPISYTRNYIERDGASSSFPMGGAEGFGYDCVTHLVFRDTRHRDACLETFTKYKDEIAKDEENFLDRSAMKTIYITETVASVA